MKSSKVVTSSLICAACFACGALVKGCATKPEIVEIEKPIEVVKEVVVEKPVEVVKYVEKVVYKDPIPTEYVPEPVVWSDADLSEDKANEILKDGDLWCYYVIGKNDNGTNAIRFRKKFNKGDKFIRFESLGNFPIIYSSIQL